MCNKKNKINTKKLPETFPGYVIAYIFLLNYITYKFIQCIAMKLRSVSSTHCGKYAVNKKKQTDCQKKEKKRKPKGKKTVAHSSVCAHAQSEPDAACARRRKNIHAVK